MSEQVEFVCGHCQKKIVEGKDALIAFTRETNPTTYRTKIAFHKDHEGCAHAAEKLWATVKEYSETCPIRVPGCTALPPETREKCKNCG